MFKTKSIQSSKLNDLTHFMLSLNENYFSLYGRQRLLIQYIVIVIWANSLRDHPHCTYYCGFED